MIKICNLYDLNEITNTYVGEKNTVNTIIHLTHLFFYTGEHGITCEAPAGQDGGNSSKVTLKNRPYS